MEFVSNFCFFPIISFGDNDVAAVDFTPSSIRFEKPGRKVVFTFKPLCCRRRSTSTGVGEGQFFGFSKFLNSFGHHFERPKKTFVVAVFWIL